MTRDCGKLDPIDDPFASNINELDICGLLDTVLRHFKDPLNDSNQSKPIFSPIHDLIFE